jgi:transposase
LALLELNRGQTYTAVAQTVGVTKQAVSIWAANYRASGLDCLSDKQRSGRPKKILSVDEAKITALACSRPPEGYSQWSLRLLADHAVELIEAESISYSGVRRILKKTNSSRT